MNSLLTAVLRLVCTGCVGLFVAGCAGGGILAGDCCVGLLAVDCGFGCGFGSDMFKAISLSCTGLVVAVPCDISWIACKEKLLYYI